MLLRSTLSGLLLLTFVAAPLYADEGAPMECAKDQYLKKRHPVADLEAREVRAVEAAASEELFVAEETAYNTLIVGGDAAVGEAPSEEETVIPDRIHNPCARLKRAHRSALLELRRQGLSGIVNPNTSTIARNGNIQCECNGIIHASALPNDPMFYAEWGLNQSNDIDMNLPEAWNMCKGSSDVVVAIIDTGIDFNHPDLQAAMWRNPGEIAGNGIDDDGNGVVDDVYGYNAINSSGNPWDDQGHGTHVAGTIGAATDNGIGVAGVAWNTRLMGSKFLASNGSGYLSDAIKAIDYVTTMRKNFGINVKVTNNSWGGGGYYSALESAIVRARNAGILFVAAAGNSSINMDSSPQYPASYAVDNIISVAAVDSNGNLAYFSNYGSTTVSVAAPGVSIASTYPGNRYEYLQGTSMAAPHVSGALALLQAYRPGLTYLEMKNTLLNSARQLQSLNGKVIGKRFVNALAMLQQAPAGGPTPTPTPIPPTPTPAPTSTPTPLPTPTLTPTITPIPEPGDYNIGGQVAFNGVGIPGARLILETSQGQTKAFAGPNGEYRIPNVRGPLNFTLTAVASGYTFNSVSGYLNAHKQFDFSGQVNRYPVSVLVRSTQGAALPGVLIDAGSWGTATTDSGGRATFMVNYGASYSVVPSLSGQQFSSSQLDGTVYGPVDRVFIALPQE